MVAVSTRQRGDATLRLMATEAQVETSRSGRLVAMLTIATFAVVEYGQPWIYAVLTLPPDGYRGLADVFVWLYSWYWIPPLLVAVALFGPRALAALGLAGSVFTGWGVAFIVTLPMLIGYAFAGELQSAQALARVAVRHALLPGVFEEILYRGFLFGFLFRFGRWPFIPAALLGAVLFGAAHSWQGADAAETAGAVLVTAVGAAWFAWLYVEWQYNLWVPIGCHVLMNLYWDAFSMGDSAAGGLAANLFRIATIATSVLLTVRRMRSRGSAVGRRWLRSDPSPRPV